jgi:integrase
MTGRWAVAMTLPDGKRKWFYGRTKTQARAKRNEAMARVSEGRQAVDASLTLADYIEQWATGTLPVSGRAASTQAQMRQLLRTHVVDQLGAMELGKIRPTHIESRVLAPMQAAGRAGSTRRSTFGALSAVMQTAVRDGLLARNPLDSLKRPQDDVARPQHLDADEVAALLAAASGTRLEAMWTVLVTLGLRRGEALGLRWDDVDLDAGVMHVERSVVRVEGVGLVVGEPKTERSRRTLPLPAVTLEALRAHHRRQAAERLRAKVWVDDQVVFSTKHGTTIEPRNVNRELNRLCEVAGLDQVGVHVLRHTFATLLLGAGEDVATVSELMGHRNTVITMTRYQHVLQANRRRAVERIDAIFAQPAG